MNLNHSCNICCAAHKHTYNFRAGSRSQPGTGGRSGTDIEKWKGLQDGSSHEATAALERKTSFRFCLIFAPILRFSIVCSIVRHMLFCVNVLLHVVDVDLCAPEMNERNHNPKCPSRTPISLQTNR